MLRKLEEQLKIHSSRKGILGLGGTAARKSWRSKRRSPANWMRSPSSGTGLIPFLRAGRPRISSRKWSCRKKYLEDLAKLEKMPVAEGEVDNFEEQLRELVGWRRRSAGRCGILAQAGSEEHEEIRRRLNV